MTRSFPLPLVLSMLLNTPAMADRIKRPMAIHRVPEIGLEIWTEQDPVWETRLDTLKGAPIFIAETSALTYPPAAMTWISLPQLRFDDRDIETGARGVVHQAAANHGVGVATDVVLERKIYGELSGYEATFSSRTQNVPVDVRIFCGHRRGMPAVVMQVSTLRGKLDAVSEHIRRSWINVRYLH